MSDRLTHFDEDGRARMVDVGDKAETKRIAVASARITMQPETAAIIREGRASKGDVLGVAEVAGIMAAKKTSDLIPMCHPLMLTKVALTCDVDNTGVDIRAEVHTRGQTGVEMEALTAASAAALTIYDMVKAVDRGMVIERIQLETKDGGRSGHWQREPDAEPATGMVCEDGVCTVPTASDPAFTPDLSAIAGIRQQMETDPE